MSDASFSTRDLQRIADHGLTRQAASAQLERFARGAHYAQLERPCRVGDGIRRFSAEDLARLGARWEGEAAKGRGMKFVPASGAGTRMFQSFLKILHGENEPAAEALMQGLPRFPFFEALRGVMAQAGHSVEACLQKKDYQTVARFLLTEAGLNYATLPKALILFHRYPQGSRTPFEEHLAEAAAYVSDAQGRCRLHFTVSEEHRPMLEAFLQQALPRFQKGPTRYEVQFSVQAKSTDTLAADAQNRPFRDRNGDLVFRPAGHGALLQNLESSGGDIVFLKNIDNVAPEGKGAEAAAYKKAMAGHLLEIQETCFSYLNRLETGSLASVELAEIEAFISSTLAATLPPDWPERRPAERERWLFERLNRPLRVAAVVPNHGEPGGAPFWVEEVGVGFSLQIIESAQVDRKDPEQERVFRSASHFNPVDLVCAIRDYRGRPFALANFVDAETGFLSEKSHEGRPLRALELPGLWNGSMARWNTVFVEAPASTFSPVKKIEDLLRPEHQIS